ncbi:MAG: DUF2089 domain-containing protein [bacterium]
MVRMPGDCPICHGRLAVRSLYCPECQVRIDGEFELPNILSLPPEQMEFVEVFLRSRGNIKEVERELGISYPTVRNRLEEVIARLGYETEPFERTDASEVLTSLEKGEITVEQAMKRLQGDG